MPDTKTRVLLIDDDEDDFIITRDTIEDIPGRNYVLDWTASFSEALGMIKEENHDVYLVDYRLGAHDGLELIEQAVKGGSMAPFILLTGQSNRETDEKAMRDFAVTNGHQCVVVEVHRPGTHEGTDVTEASRSQVNADTVIINEGSIKDLAKTAADMLHDIHKDKLKPEY